MVFDMNYPEVYGISAIQYPDFPFIVMEQNVVPQTDIVKGSQDGRTIRVQGSPSTTVIGR